MPQLNADVSCPIHDSFRVQQIAGMFDVPIERERRECFCVELPDLGETWRIGAIVGPSGSGKSTVAKAAFGESVYLPGDWPADRAVIDGFGDRPTRLIAHVLTAVGFSSPPAWLKPYTVLSTGQRFRCDLARALLADRELVVFDEFTSVVDRTVAKIGSAAVAKALRDGKLDLPGHQEEGGGMQRAAGIRRGAGVKSSAGASQRRSAAPAASAAERTQKFVAVTCHYDILEWIEPDWVLDMATGLLNRRRLRRPSITVELFRCDYSAWRLFAPHHYLSADLHRSARCYLALWGGEPVAFCALLHSGGHVGIKRISRIVVLPDFQGIGIGAQVLDAVAELVRESGSRVTLTSGHPAMIRHLDRSPHWRVRNVQKVCRHHPRVNHRWRTAHGRAVVAFEYVGNGGPLTPLRGE